MVKRRTTLAVARSPKLPSAEVTEWWGQLDKHFNVFWATGLACETEGQRRKYIEASAALLVLNRTLAEPRAYPLGDDPVLSINIANAYEIPVCLASSPLQEDYDRVPMLIAANVLGDDLLSMETDLMKVL